MKDTYEISLWEDYLVPASGIPGESGYVPEHYEEKKLCVIGSDTMTSSYRAFAPELKSEINGTHTFTFKMYYIIKENEITVNDKTFRIDEWDNFIVNGHASDEVRTPTYSTFDLKGTKNPFLNLLVNERKVKCFWKGEWYDFIIKGCREDSNGKSITYTCTDVFINELSKNGFNLVFDTDLENNTGTILELAKQVLDGTDWNLDSDNSDIVQQTKEEPAYECEVLTQEGWVVDDQSADRVPSVQEVTVTTQGGELSVREFPRIDSAVVGYISNGTVFETNNVVEGDEVDGIKAWAYYNDGTLSGYVAGKYLTPTPIIGATEPPKVTIPYGSKVLIFYQQIQNILEYFEESETTYTTADIQLAFAQNYETDVNSQLVTNAHCCIASVRIYKENYEGADCLAINDPQFPCVRIFYNAGVSNEYRASRLISQQICKLDPLTGKYCYVWTAGNIIPTEWEDLVSPGDEIYEYRATEWDDALVVNNLVVNGKDFTSNEGWLNDSDFVFTLYPPYSSASSMAEYTAKSYLHLSSGKQIYNGGIRQSSNFVPNGFKLGEKYIFRFKAYGNTGSGTDAMPDGHYITEGIVPHVRTYTDSGESKIPGSRDYFSFVRLEQTTDDWCEYRMVCRVPLTRSDIYQQKIALFLFTETNCWLEEAQFFKEVYGQDALGNTVRINPEDMDVQSVSTVKYNYYNHTQTQGLISPDDVSYLWSDSEDCIYKNYLTPVYNDNFEKVRSITAKQSNRFNLIQALAQTFECWAQFIIKHDSSGRTKYNSDGTPQKYIRFKNNIGQETGIGFVYGIDLKTITRTIQSDKIVTKTIVTQNSNEFATNGFCTISRSTENYPRTNFILNFDYYINQGLLNSGKLNNDLYDSTGDIRYYYNLNKYNTEYDDLTEFLSAKHLELEKQLSYQTVYEGTITSLQENISNLRGDLMRLADVSTWKAATSYIKEYAELDQIKSKMTALKTQEQNLATYQVMKAKLDNSIIALQNDIEAKETRQKALVDLIKALDLKFYKKYSRFIQEGSWISEDYIDDTLYYLDAQSVAYTSSRPQISYEISVIRISSIEEFKNKVFHLGDIAFIQDTEFFGYTYVNQIKTPYKEKVLISEVTSYFDEPEKDTFKVQNYKTQFEDLFQRITAATQSLQYASGEYSRAADIVEPNGTINPETLQNSFALNEQLVYSAQNESIITDSTGITVSDTTNPNKKTKVTSGGIFITTDGGTTWKNAVRGDGIATQYLTAGAINTNNISIMDGNFTAFRWDESGINAYYKLAENAGINLSKFVRFDHFGIYGINTEDGHKYVPTSESDIWRDAKFGMTWNGFFVKNKYGTHSVEISSTDDIRVMKQNIEMIKIGRIYHDPLEQNPDIFGIRISDGNGAPVMETDSTGKLWLKNRLDISSTTGDYNIGLGYLNAVKPSTSIHEVFNAHSTNPSHGGEFIVYEDGSMKATSGEFTGTIYATGGKIGNVTIGEVEQAAYRVVIESDSGTVFKNAQGTKRLTAKLYKGDTEVTTGTFVYAWFLNGTQLLQTTKYIDVTAGSLNEVCTYSCNITYTEPTE